MRKDLLCENCSQAESTHLIYHQKYHPEIGKFSLIDPLVVCDHCVELFKKSNIMFEHQPVIVPFEIIGKVWDWRFMGLLSKKGYEFNVFYKNQYWYKKLKRVKLIWKNPPKNNSNSQ